MLTTIVNVSTIRATIGVSMELSRRDLLYKCMAIGVIKLGAGLSPESAMEAWMRRENMARPATPIDQLGPFYKKGAPNTKMMRGARDPGLALGVAGAVFKTRGEGRRGAENAIWQTPNTRHYTPSGV